MSKKKSAKKSTTRPTKKPAAIAGTGGAEKPATLFDALRKANQGTEAVQASVFPQIRGIEGIGKTTAMRRIKGLKAINASLKRSGPGSGPDW